MSGLAEGEALRADVYRFDSGALDKDSCPDDAMRDNYAALLDTPRGRSLRRLNTLFQHFCTIDHKEVDRNLNLDLFLKALFSPFGNE